MTVFSPDTDQKERERENGGKIPKLRGERLGGWSSEKGINFSPKILPPHTLKHTSHTAHAAVTSPLG